MFYFVPQKMVQQKIKKKNYFFHAKNKTEHIYTKKQLF